MSTRGFSQALAQRQRNDQEWAAAKMLRALKTTKQLLPNTGRVNPAWVKQVDEAIKAAEATGIKLMPHA